ncbi:MAG: hypothetical protein WC393_04135 [Candidatus Nanoarchaeia archaeon]|jgi:hypothetical protein
MNVKIMALSLIVMVLLAGCTIAQTNQQGNESIIDSGNQTIDDLVNDYSDNITNIDLGEMI